MKRIRNGKTYEIENPELINKINRGIVNPLQTGLIKGFTQSMDILAQPKLEEIAEKYNDDPDKIYEIYKKEVSNNNWKNSSLRKATIQKIKENRVEREKYLDSDSNLDRVTMLAENIIEGIGNPLNYINPQGKVINLAWDVMQGATETFWEKTEIEEQEITKNDLPDFVAGAIMTTAIHGATGAISKGIKKINKDKYNKLPPLEKIAVQTEVNGKGAVDPQALVEIAERLEVGETLSVPRNTNFSNEIESFYDTVTINRLNKISVENTSSFNKNKNNLTGKTDAFNNKMGKDTSVKIENKIDITSDVSRALKPVKDKIKLNKHQIEAELKKELFDLNVDLGVEYTGNLHDKIGDIINSTYKDIDKNHFKYMVRNTVEGNSDFFTGETGKQLNIIEKHIRKTTNDYVNLRYGNELKTNGLHLDLVYDKNLTMNNLKSIDLNNIEETTRFKQAFLKRENNNIFLSEKEAKHYKVGTEEGMYNVSDSIIIKKLDHDINSTTKDIIYNSKALGTKPRTMLDVAVENAPFEESEIYFNMKTKKIEQDLDFMKYYEEESSNWLDSVLSEMEVEVEPTEAMTYFYKNIINERSGLNKLKEKLAPAFDEIGVDDTIKQKINFLSSQKDFKTVMKNEFDGLGLLSADIETRKYSDLTPTSKTVFNTRNAMMYKFLANLNYIKEIATNKSRINSGAIDLGFNARVGLFENTKEMGRATATAFKPIKKYLNQELKTIVDPVQRVQAEVMINKFLENNIDTAGYKKASITKTAGEFGARGQLASDVQRIATAEWFTANAMYNEFSKMEFESVTPQMKQVLLNMGIDNTIKLKEIQKEIVNHKSLIDFFDTVKSIDKRSVSKELFNQFSDIMGRELNAFDGASTRIKGTGTITGLWTKANTMFRMYSMNTMSRIFNKLTTYIDEDGLTRYRFLTEKGTGFNLNSFTGLKDVRNFSRVWNASTTSLETLGLYYGVNWATGKLIGTSKDEMIECKINGLMNGAIGDIVYDTLKTGLLDNAGLEVAMGGSNIVSSFVSQNISGIKRDLSSELSGIEKILYGATYLFAPSKISQGIDNIKFEKNIITRLNTVSNYNKKMWSKKYRKKAIKEQNKGELPYGELLVNSVGSIYNGATNFYNYFAKHPEQAEKFANYPENTPQEAKILFASGVMEEAEKLARDEQLNKILLSSDSIKEREEELKKYGMDYKNILNKVDEEDKILLASLITYHNIDSEKSILLLNDFYNMSQKERQNLFNELVPEQIKENFSIHFHNLESNQSYKKAVKSTNNIEEYVEMLTILNK